MKKLSKALLVLTGATLLLSGCGSKKTDALIVGTNAEFPPFEFVSSSGIIDQYDGIDIAIAKGVGDHIGKEVKIENMEFDALLIALANGQVDAVIAGMTVTDERKQSVDFSEPYYEATQVMIVKEGSGIKKASDMADKRIVVLQGFTGELCVQDLGYEYEAFKKGTEAILELNNDKCDVVVLDSATAQKYVADTPGLMIVEDPDAFETEEYAIAVKKGNTELLGQINDAITKMKSDGSIADWSVKYSEAE